MRIYLTKYETMSTEETHVISDAVFPQRVHWFPETYEKTKTGMFQVPKRVVDRLITPSIIEHVCKNKAPGKVGFILAGGSQVWGTGGVPLYDKCLTNSLAYSYKVEVLNVTNIFGARVASQLSANDYVATDASTCASSLKVMMDVRHLIRDYDFDRVYVLGIEDSICNTVLNFFGSAKANICLDDYEKGARPSAFDSSNGGFYLGQGGVLAVFESERSVAACDSPVRAELLGAYTAAEDNTNPLGQRADGKGYKRAIEGATKGFDHGEIKIIKTHGTGTLINNLSERSAIEHYFDDFVATSYKQRIGHTVGASGLLETCLLLNDIKNDVIPEIINRTEYDNKFTSFPQKPPKGLMLSLAAGMGNTYSAALFSPA
jgi:3-oxoacyl-(acyl-carrier-protein) synthase